MTDPDERRSARAGSHGNPPESHAARPLPAEEAPAGTDTLQSVSPDPSGPQGRERRGELRRGVGLASPHVCTSACCDRLGLRASLQEPDPLVHATPFSYR